jgi:serine phosphatase RsbU (regulator of sigma subunit)
MRATNAAERRPGDPEHAGGEMSALISRRPIALAALAALLLFVIVAGALAWRQYQEAQDTALDNARARAVLAGTVFDIYFSGRIGTLTSIAQAPVIRETDEVSMLAFLKRVQPPKGKLFPGGLGWVDRKGFVRVTTIRARPGKFGNVSDRSYFREVTKTGRPFVSEGLTARLTRQQVVSMAVPTRDASGALTGVLTGALLVKSSSPSQASLDLGYQGLAIIDRKGQSILAGFVHPKQFDADKRFGTAKSGVLSDTTGLDGEDGHVLAFARAAVPGWTVILDRTRSDVFSAARRTLMLELALLGGVALLAVALLLWILNRVRSDARAERERSLQRRQQYEQEHRVATTLQRSLLVDVPQIDAIESAARYQPGSTGLEVGGDWFDVLRRPDGIVHVTVGDVAGHGIAAAALMGQLRNAFRAYAYEHASPAAVMSRMHRHIGPDEMATAICIAIDPYAQEFAYSSAGHPPPLLRDAATGTVTRLEGAQSPVLAHVSRTPVPEARLALPNRVTLVVYTDGMVERRDQVIDAGIDRLAAELSAVEPGTTAGELADKLIRDVAAVTAADDDIALLVMQFGEVPVTVDIELAPGDAGVVAETLRRLRPWLLARGVPESECDDVLRDIGEALRGQPDPSEPFGLHLRVEIDGGEVRTTVGEGALRMVWSRSE